MVNVVISVGSNCGDRKKSVEETIEWLKSILSQVQCSSIYETPCAKHTGIPYMNVVISGFYQGQGFELEDLLKEKEHQMGRNTECREKGLVPVDIDIVILDGDITKPWDYRQKFFQIGYSQINTGMKAVYRIPPSNI